MIGRSTHLLEPRARGTLRPRRGSVIVRGQATIQSIADTDDFAVAKQHVPAKAVHGQLVVRPPGLKPLGSHLRATDAGRLQTRPAHAQRLQQQPSEHVARGFAGHHGQIQGGACSHLPRPI